MQATVNTKAGEYNLVTFGYEFEREQYYTFNGTTSSTNSVDLRQRSNAFYVQDQIRLIDGQLQLTVSGRIQKFNLTPPTFTGSSANP
jgi:outer membrane receptor protein involved in Fe transport